MPDQDNPSLPPDRLNAVGVLTRREIEARLVTPLLEALSAEFGQEQVLEIAREVIGKIARQQGEQLAANAGGNSLVHFAAALEAWRKGEALEMEVIEQTEERYAFNVKRCRYAEMYQALGIPELGKILSCNRDAALIEGFNPQIAFDRTQTILSGAPCCDFRYSIKPQVESAG